jgi:hypothetical protein
LGIIPEQQIFAKRVLSRVTRLHHESTQVYPLLVQQQILENVFTFPQAAFRFNPRPSCATIDKGLAVHRCIGLSFQPRQASFKLVRQEFVIGIQKSDILAAGRLHAAIPIRGGSILKTRNQTNLRAVKALQNAADVISRLYVVNHDDLEVADCLYETGMNGLGDSMGAIISWNDDAE